MNSSPHTINVLNRLVVIHHRSLCSYLSYASPIGHRYGESAKLELQRISADQQDLVDRLGELIVQYDGTVFYGSYPMDFTGYHDLSFDFLLDKLIEHQRHDLAAIEASVKQLDDAAPAARSLAQEALGMAKGHLESLEELKNSAVSN